MGYRVFIGETEIGMGHRVIFFRIDQDVAYFQTNFKRICFNKFWIFFSTSVSRASLLSALVYGLVNFFPPRKSQRRQVPETVRLCSDRLQGGHLSENEDDRARRLFAIWMCLNKVCRKCKNFIIHEKKNIGKVIN
jgi:hypothetical protein